MSGFNVHSDEWIFASKYLKARIEQLHIDNENESLSEAETAHIRGQIAMAREALKIPEYDKQAPVVDSGQYL